MNSKPAFDFNTLETLQTFKEKRDYLNSTLKWLGDGLSRTVYELPDGKAVLKLQKIGKNQNMFEYEASKCLDPNYIAKILKVAGDLSWLVMEKTTIVPTDQALTNEIVKRAPGMALFYKNSYSIGDVVDYVVSDDAVFHTQELVDAASKLVKTDKWINGLIKTMAQCQVSANDMHNNNWGITKDGRLVLIDYGMEM